MNSKFREALLKLNCSVSDFPTFKKKSSNVVRNKYDLSLEFHSETQPRLIAETDN